MFWPGSETFDTDSRFKKKRMGIVITELDLYCQGRLKHQALPRTLSNKDLNGNRKNSEFVTGMKYVPSTFFKRKL